MLLEDWRLFPPSPWVSRALALDNTWNHYQTPVAFPGVRRHSLVSVEVEWDALRLARRRGLGGWVMLAWFIEQWVVITWIESSPEHSLEKTGNWILLKMNRLIFRVFTPFCNCCVVSAMFARRLVCWGACRAWRSECFASQGLEFLGYCSYCCSLDTFITDKQ